jgi:RNA polymerase sigma-70 factor (ECF subfamily)
VSAPAKREGAERRAELALQYCEGDHAAFRELYALAAPRLLAYVRRLATDPTTAEEILQSTFMKLHLSRGTYARGADPLPWLYTIAHRTFLDEARRRKRSKVSLAREDGLTDAPATMDGPAEDEALYSPEQISAVLAALHALPAGQREALRLTKIEGMSVADAAAALGTTRGALKVRAHRGYVALRELFKREVIAGESP